MTNIFPATVMVKSSVKVLSVTTAMEHLVRVAEEQQTLVLQV